MLKGESGSESGYLDGGISGDYYRDDSRDPPPPHPHLSTSKLVEVKSCQHS